MRNKFLRFLICLIPALTALSALSLFNCHVDRVTEPTSGSETGNAKRTSSISISLPPIPEDDTCFIYIPGTDIIEQIITPQTDTFVVTLDSIPMGLYSQLIFSRNSDPENSIVLAINFSVDSGDVLDIKPEADITPISTLNIKGVIVHEDGSPAPGIYVELFPEIYNPLSKKTHIGYQLVQTDSSGTYLFRGLDSGKYFLEAEALATGNKFSHPLFHLADTAIDLGTDTITPTGSVLLPLPALQKGQDAYIYIPHSTVVRKVEQTHTNRLQIRLDSIPSGFIRKILLSSHPELEEPLLLADSLRLAPGAFHIIQPYRAWQYSTTLTINTSAIDEDVSNFPLLIRLDKQHFNFSQANSNGHDLRFSTPNGVALDYEIELWTDSLAAIWVKIDTIRNSNKAHYLKMYWGNDNVPSRANPNHVFSSENGFAGVWHLGESAAGTGSKALYRNSVEDDNHGDDEISSDVHSDLIGRGVYMTYADHIPVENAANILKPDTTVMISAWVRFTETGIGGADVISMGDDYLLRVHDTSAVTIYNYNEPLIAHDHLTVNSPVAKDLWHHIVGIHTARGYSIYIDGVPAGSGTGPGVIHYDLKSNLIFGAHGNNKDQMNYQGHLDEIRISTKERSAAWIRLCFENQRENSELVSFE